MTRFLITFALMLFIVWWVRRLFTPRRPRAPRGRPDVIDATYTVVDEKADKERTP